MQCTVVHCNESARNYTETTNLSLFLRSDCQCWMQFKNTFWQRQPSALSPSPHLFTPSFTFSPARPTIHSFSHFWPSWWVAALEQVQPRTLVRWVEYLWVWVLTKWGGDDKWQGSHFDIFWSLPHFWSQQWALCRDLWEGINASSAPSFKAKCKCGT